MPPNDQVLLQVGYLITSTRELLPNIDLKMEDNNYSQRVIRQAQATVRRAFYTIGQV